MKVIKACKEADVSEIKIGEIQITFGKPEVKVESTVGPIPVSVLSEGEFNQAAANINLRENIEDKESHLSLMAVSDPAQYERLLIERELEDGRTA